MRKKLCLAGLAVRLFPWALPRVTIITPFQGAGEEKTHPATPQGYYFDTLSGYLVQIFVFEQVVFNCFHIVLLLLTPHHFGESLFRFTGRGQGGEVFEIFIISHNPEIHTMNINLLIFDLYLLTTSGRGSLKGPTGSATY